MKQFKSLKVVSLFALSAFALAATQDAVSLKLVLKEGDKDVYKVASVVDQEVDASAFGAGPMNMKIESSMTLTYNTGKVDDKGIAAMVIDVTDADMKFDGPMGAPPGMEMPKSYKVLGKMNSMGQFSDVKIEGLPAMAMMMSGSSMSSMLNTVSLPDKGVKIGDTWDVVLPKNPMMGDSDSKMKATFVATKDVDGKKVHEISVVGPVTLNMDTSKLPADATGGMAMKMTGTIDIKTTVQLDAATCKVRLADSTGKMNMKVELVDMSATLPMTGTYTTIMKMQ